ncbi:hypothetical protein ABEB36_009940 [Hypothenemus hampei]|uniref:Protein-lysine N-methyltransferase SMYD4 n=1 Tax=Hypothenemus hampei TaxID=57062 RepID=A0ABD1EHZ3_HYPHA
MALGNFQDVEYRQICSEKTLQSNSQGFFLDCYNMFIQEAGNKWIKTIFGKAKSDKERLELLYKSQETSELLRNFLNNIQEVFRSKNAEVSQKRRLEGETLIKQNDYNRALILFSQSVIRAPKTGTEKRFDSGLSLSLALWGRSEALLHLKKFSEALMDIQQALKENLPASFKARAFWNMGICYEGTNEPSRAKISFNLAENLLQNDLEKLQKLIGLKRQILNNSEKIPEMHSIKPNISGNINEIIPNVSRKLKVKSSKKFGRYMVAGERIPVGDHLVVESPYAACLLPEMSGTHCHECFKRLLAPYGCEDCASVAFCSVECREKAQKTYHQYECKFLDLLIGSGMSILGYTALRMVTQKGLAECLKIYKNRDKEPIYKLCTNSHLRSPEDFLQRTLMSTFLLRILQKSHFFPENTNQISEMQLSIGEMILFNLQMLQFNAHEVYETIIDKLKSKISHIGVAVYLSASLFNHACNPALSRHFFGKDIILSSLRPLEANEIVPENYGPVFTRKTLMERKRCLWSRYWFDCCCVACEQEWPGIGRGLEGVNKRLRCTTEECKQFFTTPLKKNIVECSKCRKTIDLTKHIELSFWCETQYQVAADEMEKNQFENATKRLSEAITVFYRISCSPNKETHMAEEMLSKCLAQSGNQFKS